MAEKKILIVDTDASHLDFLTQLFKPARFKIIRAKDGVEAHEKFNEERPDLVILEALLPRLHGFDLTKKLTQESRGEVPIIIITGLYKGSHYRHEAISSFGATDYFEKPYDKEKLLNTVLSLLNEEEEIQDELPDSEAIVQNLSKRIKK
jgi:two-component system alkaline phosphatase synthesis response regulator PhoP